MRAFSGEGVDHGVVASGFEDRDDAYVQIASISSLINRYGKLPAPKLIVWDECHHVAAASWAKIFDAYPEAFHIGLTATPERLDGKGLRTWFKHMINGPTVESLIDQGYLSRYRLFAPRGVSLEGVHTRMGDYVRSDLVRAVDRPTITGDAIREYTRRCAGKRAVVFCVSIEHSQHVVEQFKAAGISAEHVDGETDTATRDAAITKFSKGETLVLSNVDLFGEGFDVPAIEAVIDIAPTQSLSKFLQRCGRALRPAPGKDTAIILDHAGNVERHGLPDEQRQWSLDGRDERTSAARGNDTTVRICPKCFAAQFSGKPICIACSTVFEIKSREVEHVEGDLVEVDSATRQMRLIDEQRTALSLGDLVELGKRRGYKRPHLWAKHIFNARQAKRLRRAG
jgi:DNA repair protein RadD